MAITVELPIVATIHTLVNRIRRVVPRPLVPMGQVWWLNNGHAAAADRPDYGTDMDHPFATLLYALTQCVSGRGDILVIVGGSSETYDLGTYDQYDTAVSGLTIFGLGNHQYGPCLLLDTADDRLEIDGDDITIYNLRLRHQGAGNRPDNAFALAGERCAVIGCRIYPADSPTSKFIDEAVIDVQASGARIIGNFIDAGDGTAPDFPDCGVKLSEDVDDVWIVGNVFGSAFSDGAIYQPAGKTATNLLIRDNCLYNAVEETNHRGLVRLEGTATGVIDELRGYGYDTVGTSALIYNDSCACSQNFVTNALATSGVLEP